MSKNLIGLDIGTGSVKVATVDNTFTFPSIIASGKNMDLESKDQILVGDDALKFENVKSMVLRTPVYRGEPTSINDYMVLVKHALDKILKPQKNALYEPQKYSDCVIVAGIPYNAKSLAPKIKNAINDTFAPKLFGLMYQAKATLDNEGMNDGIVCHIGHGTTEMMEVSHGSIAQAQTISHGVGDITSSITQSKTGYLDFEIFSKNTIQLAEHRKILAAHISDGLEKIVIDYPQLQVICAGSGALIPKLVSEIKNDRITNIKIAQNPVFSNALGMLKKATSHAN